MRLLGTRPRIRRAPLAVAAIALALLATATPSSAQADGPLTLTIDVGSDAGTVNADLGGFNWREGGTAVGPLEPGLVRMWSVDFSKITSAPGVYDWTLPDRHVAEIRSIGATPLIVLVGRPPWSPTAGSAGYQEAVTAAMQRYGVEQRPAGARPTWFESGNEPEFPPTSHGQLLHDVPLDAAAQAGAVQTIEAAGEQIHWGGPGALFANFVTIESFALAGEAAGRTPDYLSWHSYTNQPLLGPDGAEFSDPVSAAGYEALKGTNPLATPRIIGMSSELVQVMAAPFTAPDGEPPDAVLTEWHLSSGGLDLRHDTAEGAAHTAGGLIEAQRTGTGAAAFFSAVDRHCDQPDDAPDPMCGDWGTASADGVRKPVWWLFDWWRSMTGATVLDLTGDDPEGGLWALASRDGDTVRVLVASFSVATPTDRTITLEFGVPAASATVSRLADSGAAAPTSTSLDPGALTFELPANRPVMVEVELASSGAAAPAAPDSAEATDTPTAQPTQRLPATGHDQRWSLLAAGALALAALSGRVQKSRYE